MRDLRKPTLVKLCLVLMMLLGTAAAMAVVQYPTYPDDGSSPCQMSIWTDCTLSCVGPNQFRCCCVYHCPSGDANVCRPGYCPNTIYAWCA